MKIGLIIATNNEYDAILKGFSLKEINKCFPFNEIVYNYKNKHELILVKGGIGEIASSSLTQYLITKYNIDLLLNYGACGAIKNNYRLNEVVLVNEVVHYGFDISLIDKVKVGQYPNFDSPIINFNNNYIDNLKNKLNLKVVRCASSDKFVANKEDKFNLINEFDVDICEMELAGIVLTSLKNNVPLISLKGISDSADNNEYMENVNNTCETLVKVVKDILDNL